MRNLFLKISVYFILFILIENCYTFHSYNFKDLKTEVNPDLRNSVPIFYSPDNFTQERIELGEIIYPWTRVDSSGVAIHILDEKIKQKNFSPLNYLSYLTLCILPCIYETEYTIDLSYSKYSKEERIEKINKYFYTESIPHEIALPKGAIHSEKINYSIKQVGFLFAYQDDTNFIRFNNLSSNYRYSNTIAKDFLPLTSYLRTQLDKYSIINSETQKNEDKIILEKLEELPKNKCKNIYDFHEAYDNSNKEIKDRIWKKFDQCIEAKVNNYAQKKYPFLKNHLENEIFFWNKTSEYLVLDLLHAPFLSIVPESKYKLRDDEFKFQKINENKFNLNIVSDNQLITIEFEKRDSVLYCNFIEIGGQKLTQGSQMESILLTLFKKLYTYPQEYSHWDWELIDK